MTPGETGFLQVDDPSAPSGGYLKLVIDGLRQPDDPIKKIRAMFDEWRKTHPCSPGAGSDAGADGASGGGGSGGAGGGAGGAADAGGETGGAGRGGTDGSASGAGGGPGGSDGPDGRSDQDAGDGSAGDSPPRGAGQGQGCACGMGGGSSARVAWEVAVLLACAGVPRRSRRSSRC